MSTPLFNEYLRPWARDLLSPEPPSIDVHPVTLYDRERAYALAIEIMAAADRLWADRG